MKKFQVGGAVRDQLMGVEPRDIDWLVTHTTPDTLKASGYKQVGRDFAVFLHPETGEEHAFPRGLTENEVLTMDANDQLRHDLRLRDFTVNAMAFNENILVDPCRGIVDLESKTLRHTSPSTFTDDPVRIVRLARLAARLDFTMAPETIDLVKENIQAGHLANKMGPRILMDINKAFEETHPVQFIKNLITLNAFDEVFPVLAIARQDEIFMSLRFNLMEKAFDQGLSRYCMMAIMLGGIGEKAIRHQIDLWKGSDLMLSVALLYDKHQHPLDLDNHDDVVSFIENNRALHGSMPVLEICELWSLNGFDGNRFYKMLDRVSAVDAETIAASLKGQPEKIKAALHQARVSAAIEADTLVAVPVLTPNLGS